MISCRRSILSLALSLVLTSIVLLLYGCTSTPALSSNTPTKSPYTGKTLRVLLVNHPWTEAIKPLIPQFEQQTGITVKVESYGEDQISDKLSTELTTGHSDIDVFMQRPLQEARLYVKNGWSTDLSPLANDKTRTPADWDFQDFDPRAIDILRVKGILTGIPIVVEHEVLYYRKDLLQQAGIPVPKTLDELRQAAVMLTAPEKQQYGFVARGRSANAVTQFSSFLYDYGGDWFDQSTRKATLNSPQAIEAFKLYGSLLRNYGPPGVTNMSWPQAVAIFNQGNAAMYTDADSLYSNLLDPNKSLFASQTGVAPFPSGPDGFHPYSICSWGLSINANAPHKDAAWAFITWATSKAITLKVQGESAVPEARLSVYQQPDGVAKFPKDWLAAAQVSASGQQYDRPLVVQVPQARDIIGNVIVTAIQGGDVESAAQQANNQLQILLGSELSQ